MTGPAPPTFTPALGKAWLTPAYDAAIALLTRERVWRTALVSCIAPRRSMRVLDIGCGTGALLLAINDTEPNADLVGLDPDPAVLARARRKAEKRKARIAFVEGFFGDAALQHDWQPDVITSSLVFHQVPMAEKRRILSHAWGILPGGGRLVIADYGLQRTRLMRTLFRNTVQRLDGVADTTPNAEGVLPLLIEQAGFDGVREVKVYPTVTGSISIYSAHKP
ncbi:MAG: class I SAM-dependent methyltransferase [Oceanicaulis sp.]|nr:class I SAM-dependent methyltransferase [Oceanicaulis sp.]